MVATMQLVGRGVEAFLVPRLAKPRGQAAVEWVLFGCEKDDYYYYRQVDVKCSNRLCSTDLGHDIDRFLNDTLIAHTRLLLLRTLLPFFLLVFLIQQMRKTKVCPFSTA